MKTEYISMVGTMTSKNIMSSTNNIPLSPNDVFEFN